MSGCPCEKNWKTGEYHESWCSEAKKLRDSWATPAELAGLLPEADLDPATNPRSLIKAKQGIVWRNDPLRSTYSEHLPGRFIYGDGLSIPWTGSIFLNGPYSDMLPWCQKANEEWGAGRLTAAIFLVKLDPTTRWWRELVTLRQGPQRCVDLWLPYKRQQHIPPPRIRPSTNNFASAIIHWRQYQMPRTQPKLDVLTKIARLWT